MSQATKLNHLQDIDDKIQQTQERLKEIENALNNDEAVRSARAAVASAEETLSPLRAKSKDLELELEGTINKSKVTEQRLYSGKVQNTKELEDMQNEIVSLKSRKETLEERTLMLMMEVEAAEEELDTLETALEKTLRSRETQMEAMTTEQSAKTRQLVELRQQREGVRNEIEPEYLNLYDRLQKRIRLSVVAKMTSDGTCSKCGVRQTRTAESDIRRGNVMQCSNCGRILVF